VSRRSESCAWGGDDVGWPRRWPLTARYVVIEERFCGPPDSGNGGYVCGLVAGILGQEAEVTLRRPPPIGRAMLVRRSAEGGITLCDREEVVAEALPGRLQIKPPDVGEDHLGTGISVGRYGSAVR
jgi:hypothetical protein